MEWLHAGAWLMTCVLEGSHWMGPLYAAWFRLAHALLRALRGIARLRDCVRRVLVAGDAGAGSAADLLHHLAKSAAKEKCPSRACSAGSGQSRPSQEEE